MFKKKKWKQVFKRNQLGNFSELWSKEVEWFEEPNQGKQKDSWSGVSKLTLDDSDFFMKKQHNYKKTNLLNPLGENLAEKEFKNIQLFKSLGIPAMTSVYFKKKKSSGKECAILITRSLNKYKSLSEINKLYPQGTLPINTRRLIIYESAKLIQLAHSKRVKIQSLYPKHVFVHRKVFGEGLLPKSSPPCRFIDLERARRVIQSRKNARKDLETFNRRCTFASKSDRLFFLLVYLGEKKVTQKVRDYISKLDVIKK